MSCCRSGVGSQPSGKNCSARGAENHGLDDEKALRRQQCVPVDGFGRDILSRQLAVNPSMGARWRHPCRQRLAQKAVSPSLTGSMTAQAVLFRGWGHTRMATQTEYKEGSSLLGRVLKRLCSHMYCSGAWRTAASMTRLLRLASRWSSPLGKSASGASMTNR